MHASSFPSLAHLDRMTDSAGLIQHAIYNIPRRSSGYTTDDNARALRLCVRLCADHSDERMLERVACYLSFMEHAQQSAGGFHNFMSYQRNWLDDNGCGDSQGQAVLALAEVRAGNVPRGFRDLAKELMDNAAPVLRDLTSLRAHAYVVQAWGILRRARVAGIGELESIARNAVGHLVNAWQANQHVGWEWFEPQMTYANAVLPHAMFDAADGWSDEEYLSIAESSFRFLDKATTTGNIFWPVGNDGWYSQTGEKSLYDQQPVEASTMAAAALSAMELQHDQDYLVAFQKAHGWFHGENSLHSSMADTETGGCHDGLESTGVNRNFGAESTLAYLWTEVLALDAHLVPNNATSVYSSLRSVPQFTERPERRDGTPDIEITSPVFLTGREF
ncbi:MAG: hypothetical protein KDA91_20495 [Planctomycetaceae bacterium]|nr:hypothetical protein [Planctomycetaceae bacterium]